MRAKFNSFHRAVHRVFGTVVCAGAMLLMAASAPAQNLFVGNLVTYPPYTNTITEITPSGVRSTFASGLSNPAELAFDNVGNLFEADGTGHIYKFTPSGVRSTFASGFFAPRGFAFDGAGGVYVASSDGNIYRVTSGGVQSTFASNLAPAFGGLAVNNAGDLFEVDVGVGGNIIYEFTPGGVQSTFASGLTAYPAFLTIDSTGDLFLADYGGHIYKFTPDGVKSTFASGLNEPAGLAFNSMGNLFVADYGSGNIYEFTPDGTRSTFASGLDEPGALAFEPSPELMAAVTNGVIQVAVSMPPPNYSTIVQVSTDMTNWTSVCTNTPPFTFTNSIDTTLPGRFYRALLGP